MRILAFMFKVSACMLRQTGEKSPGVRHIVHSVVQDEIARSTKTALPAPGLVSIPSLQLFHHAFAPPPLTVPPVARRPDDANCSRPKSACPPFWPVTNPMSMALHALIRPLCPCGNDSARRATGGECQRSTGRRARCSTIDARGRLPEAVYAGEKFRQLK